MMTQVAFPVNINVRKTSIIGNDLSDYQQHFFNPRVLLNKHL